MPNKTIEPLKKCGDKLCEIRLRNGFPIKVKIGFKTMYLSYNGLTYDKKNALICHIDDIDYIIKKVTEYSIYAHNDKIKNGYLDAGNGIRIGLCGECVYDGQAIKTIKNIRSLNVRIPHEISGCADHIFDKIINLEQIVYNTLIVSSPMKGKTTMLKDIIRKLNCDFSYQILVVDERGEMINVKGENVDIISFSDKKFAFECGIRSLSPDIIVVDELYSHSDWENIENASRCGVKVIASCHASNIKELIQKPFFKKNVFDRYVVFSQENVLGAIDGVYDKDFILV